uniref:Uncharacterized protein n=1 Tax=Thermosporothrix sp. COM3 TaxID=2490863 RepID=A0A455SME4_9CHLR|nr:hypothetical protein KTC_28330 [Thermosporothrix sp. COM3]
MRKYCKAYHLRDLRLFSGWTEKRSEGEPELTDDTICYLWDDLTVVRSPVQEQEPLFAEVTPEWEAFCRNTLNFAIPEDLRYAYQQAERGELLYNGKK